MDEQIRELERQLATGDTSVQEKLDKLRLKMGIFPSWRYLLAEYMKTQALLKTHLFLSIESHLNAYFEKHKNSGVEGFYWGIGTRSDFGGWDGGIWHCPDNWDIEGLGIDIHDDVWADHCNISPCEGSDSDARILISHLKGICNCRPGNTIKCWIEHSDYEKPFHWLDDNQKQALLAALEDAIKIYELLNETQRSLIHPKGINFKYKPEKGLVAEPKETT